MNQSSNIARAPLRISFGGGGTDLEPYYARHGGFVVSATITRYAYVIAGPSGDGSLRLNSADFRQWERHEGAVPVGGTLSLPRAVLQHFRHRLPGGVDLFLSAEVPPGTGLGSSSAMTVALIRALAAWTGEEMTAEQVASLACHLEIEELGLPIGKQDQYASAFGGLNAITFTADGVEVEPLELSPQVSSALSARLLLFATGRSRHSGHILREQRARTARSSSVINSLHRLKLLAQEMRHALCSEDLDRFGALLHTGWQYKKRLSSKISTPDIDRWYAAAREVGALGGKITGAGGGGFLLLYCPPERQPALRQTMAEFGLTELSFDFDQLGAHVVAGESAPAARDLAPPAPQPDPPGEDILAQAAGKLVGCYRRGGAVVLVGDRHSEAAVSTLARDLARGTTHRWVPPFRVIPLLLGAPPEPGISAAHLPSLLGQDDLVIVLGGTVAPVRAALHDARDAGATTLALTDAGTPDYQADLTLHAAAGEARLETARRLCRAFRRRLRENDDEPLALPRLAR